MECPRISKSRLVVLARKEKEKVKWCKNKPGYRQRKRTIEIVLPIYEPRYCCVEYSSWT
jgi:hypothetical protein